MKRAIPAILLTAAGFFFVWRYQPGTATDVTDTVAAPPPTVIPSLPPQASSSGGTTTTTKTKTVSGTPETNRYGTVQVEVVFTGEQITDVRFLRLPNTRPSRMARPILREETLRAQSAQVDTVSGATMTSESYVRSLQAAIDAKGP
jgi:uncharacterized protein with FMN-binding domain